MRKWRRSAQRGAPPLRMEGEGGALRLGEDLCTLRALIGAGWGRGANGEALAEKGVPNNLKKERGKRENSGSFGALGQALRSEQTFLLVLLARLIVARTHFMVCTVLYLLLLKRLQLPRSARAVWRGDLAGCRSEGSPSPTGTRATGTTETPHLPADPCAWPPPTLRDPTRSRSMAS